MHFTLRQLQVFLAVAQTGNLTRSAQQLNMSQSAASSALKDLETQFDLLLFDRIGKRLHLNQKGEELRPRAERLMAMADELEHSLLQDNNVVELNIGATLTIANYLAPQMIAEYLQQNPDAPISLDIHNTEHIIEKVLNYELDLGMIEGDFHHPQLSVTAWSQDQLQVFCSPQHPYATKQALDENDLRHADWILRETGSGTRQTFNRAMHGILPEIRIALELPETEAIKRAVKHNIGIGCLSLLTVEEEFKRGDLVKLNTPNRDLNRKLYLIMHKQKHLSASMQNWLSLCQQWATD